MLKSRARWIVISSGVCVAVVGYYVFAGSLVVAPADSPSDLAVGSAAVSAVQGVQGAQGAQGAQAAPAANAPSVPGAPVPADVVHPKSLAVSAVSADWVTEVAGKTGIPARALTAYAAAALRVAADLPQCGIGWNTVAAIGYVESAHGSHGEATLADTGLSHPQIRGPALAGGEYAAIKDTDRGVWDGDAQWDRAIGPMQFIPSTWTTWSSDGDGDGVGDPNQIDDAALAAARYLCHGGSMTTPERWRAAVFSYNHLDSYVDLIAETANTYARQAR